MPVVTLPKDKLVKEGNAFNLTCTVDSSPRSSITLYKDGDEILCHKDISHDLKEKYSPDTCTYHVEKSESSHHGSYSCVAQNQIGRTSADMNVTVGGRLNFHIIHSKRTYIFFNLFLLLNC